MTGALPLEQYVNVLFDPLNKKPAGPALSSRGNLANQLNPLAESSGKKASVRHTVTPAITALYATAAVEMWQRAIHSFLISSSATQSSPMWASVSGYYASHYCFRGIAHILGYFQLQRRKRIARVEISGGSYWCHIERKDGSDREHKFYWQIVKDNAFFKNDPFFSPDKKAGSDDFTDSAHRSIANYWDHLDQFPKFHTLNEDYLKRRIEQLSKIELSSVPSPRDEEYYPDVENVQLIAYHRIVRFRKFLDERLGGKNRFWSVHRNPSWCENIINFQVVEPRFLGVYGES